MCCPATHQRSGWAGYEHDKKNGRHFIRDVKTPDAMHQAF